MANEQLVAEGLTQPFQCAAHRWLAEGTAFGRSGHMPLLQQYHERPKEIKVESTQMLIAHENHFNYALDKCNENRYVAPKCDQTAFGVKRGRI